MKFDQKCSTHQVKPKEEWFIASTRLFKKKKKKSTKKYVTLHQHCDWIKIHCKPIASLAFSSYFVFKI